MTNLCDACGDWMLQPDKHETSEQEAFRHCCSWQCAAVWYESELREARQAALRDVKHFGESIRSQAKRIAELEAENEELKAAAAYAYVAIYREGWEEGLTANEAGERLSDILSNRGLNTLEEMQAWLRKESAGRLNGGEGEASG